MEFGPQVGKNEARHRGASMAWWKRESVPVCEVCGAKLPEGSALLVQKNYFVDDEMKTVRDICEACRQRHFPQEEEVLARLRDGDAEVRATAALELRRRRWGTVSDLRDALVREGWQSPVGREIVKALAARRGNEEAESALIVVLQNDDLNWRASQSSDGWGPLPSDAEVILGALGDLGGPTLVVQALCDTMASASLTPSVRSKAADYLSNIAYRFTVGSDVTPMSYGKLTGVDRMVMVKALRAALRDESEWVRQHAARALGHIGTK